MTNAAVGRLRVASATGNLLCRLPLQAAQALQIFLSPGRQQSMQQQLGHAELTDAAQVCFQATSDSFRELPLREVAAVFRRLATVDHVPPGAMFQAVEMLLMDLAAKAATQGGGSSQGYRPVGMSNISSIVHGAASLGCRLERLFASARQLWESDCRALRRGREDRAAPPSAACQFAWGMACAGRLPTPSALRALPSD